MTIEFHCPHCQKLLKTADDKAGVRANCPGCGEPVTVPDPALAAAGEAAQADSSWAPETPSAAATGDPAAAEREPAVEHSPDETTTCPMCGARIKAAATKCRFCGESLGERRSGVPTQIDAGEILSRSWELYLSQFWMVFGVVWIAIVIELAVNFGGQIVQGAISFGMMRAAGGGPNAVGILVATYGISLLFMLVNFAVNSYLAAGLHVALLKLGRGERAELGDLFTGGRFFWRFFWGNLLFTIMLYVGLLLLIVPGIIVALMFWPFLYVIVDRNVGVIESLRQSRELTTGNYLAPFVLFLAGMGIGLAGLLALCIGLFPAIPFVALIFAVAYCGMSGQLATAPVERKSA